MGGGQSGGGKWLYNIGKRGLTIIFIGKIAYRERDFGDILLGTRITA